MTTTMHGISAEIGAAIANFGVTAHREYYPQTGDTITLIASDGSQLGCAWRPGGQGEWFASRTYEQPERFAAEDEAVLHAATAPHPTRHLAYLLSRPSRRR